ncbi:MAG: outer membrane beta-barrel protein [Sphingobacteriales bacterium]
MRYIYLFCLFFFFFAATASAQNAYSVKGVTADSVEHVKLGNTTILILEAKDSIMRKFTRTAADGSFSMAGLPKGKYLLLVSYPDYADYSEPFSLDSAHQIHNFGQINMSLKSRLLKEVIIKGTAAQMKIKGDTTEFNARAFVTQPNAKVEDLLKQLPGIQVDKDGNITAEGEKVKKVLVDGEEFFGDDPTLVTKNIRADMVDKVQLYDKKSDQATFTGIDDGKKEKTINIKLREDKKNGMFGKEEIGGGTDGVYQGTLLFNVFKAKQKLSVYGTIGTNGKVGLGWEDNQKYGSGGGFEMDDSGSGMMFFGGSGSSDDLDSFGGQYNGQGLPFARQGGVHYDTKWNDTKESLNLNFKIGAINLDGTNEDLVQNNVRDTVFKSKSDQTYHNYMFRQKLDMVYQVKLDTSSNLKISVDGTLKHSTTNSSYISSENKQDTIPVNDETRDLTNTVDQKAFNASAFYTHKFKKVGRTLSFRVSEAYSQSKANGFLKQHINFYGPQKHLDSVQRVDEAKNNNLQSQAITTNLTYSEPFSKYFAILLNYGIGVSNSTANRVTDTAAAPGQPYNIFIKTLSSDFSLNQFSNQAGAIFNYKKGKIIFNFGSKASYVNFREVNELDNTPLNRNFINWMPQARFEYRFSQQKSFNINYNGNTTQPTLDQIQPIINDNDRLNLVVGNPNLTPSFTNSLNLGYRSYKVLGDQAFNIFGNYSVTTNPIVNHITYNTATAASTSEYFNLPGKPTTSFYVYSYYGRKVEPLGGLQVGLSMNANGNVYYNYVDEALNRTTNYVLNPSLNLSRYIEKKLELGLQGGPTYTISGSSLNPTVNNNGWGANANLNLTIYLPGKFQIGSYSQYQYQAKSQSFPQDFSSVVVNPFIIKTFTKTDNLKVELWGNDIFNQNVGFSRSANANLITQNSYTTIKRYFMLTISYDFTKMGGGAPKK